MVIDVKRDGNRIVIQRKGLIIVGAQGNLNMQLKRVKDIYSERDDWETGLIGGDMLVSQLLPMFCFNPVMNMDVSRVFGGKGSFVVAEGLDREKLYNSLEEFVGTTGFELAEPRDDFKQMVLQSVPMRAGIYGVAEGRAEEGEDFERAYGALNYIAFLNNTGISSDEVKRKAFVKFGALF